MKYKIPAGTKISRRDFKEHSQISGNPYRGWYGFHTRYEVIYDESDRAAEPDEPHFYHFRINDPTFDLISVRRTSVELIDK